ncbi:hypothetical protein [Rhodovulum marinum]|nr:hypothetical protein [Rhodovulum marinum]
MSQPPSFRIVDALIALAARDGLGETVDWHEVEAAIAALVLDPVGPSNLRRRMAKLNDPEVARTLNDWFLRAAADRGADAREAARPADTLLAPIQNVGLGAAATAAVLTAAGTLGLGAGVLIGLGALLAAGSASLGRYLLADRANRAQADADAIRRCIESVKKDPRS